MNGSSSAKKRRGPGRKFPKGDCEYRHKHGPLNIDEVSFQVAAKKAFIAGGAKDENFLAVCDVVWKLAKRGVPWAVQMVMDRILGKVKDSIEHSGDVKLTCHFDFEGSNG